MSRQVNSESILPNDISPSLTNSTDISNNNNINDNSTTSNNDNNNDSSKNNSNNNQNTSNYSSNDNDRRKMPEVVVKGPPNKKDDYDIDDEVMGFMHAYIQSSSQNDEVDNMSSSKGKPDSSPTDGPSSSTYSPVNDNMPSWDAPLKSARDNALAPDDYK